MTMGPTHPDEPVSVTARNDEQYRVPEALQGQRLDVVVAALTGRSRAQAASSIDEGNVRLDGRHAPRSTRVTVGARVSVATHDPVAPPDMPQVLYRDDDLLVVNKPAGLVVHPGAGHVADTLVDALRAHGVALSPGSDGGRPGIVHRLDRQTSGAMVVASTPEAYHGLVDAIAQRKVTRRYLALVAGRPDASRGRIEGDLGRDPRHRERFAVVAGGRAAVTRYQVITSQPFPDGPGPSASASGGHSAAGFVSLVLCTLETGRTHQIRVHLAAMGHPVLADETYAHRWAIEAGHRLGIQRVALHAWQLAFLHPVTARPVDVVAPPPEDFARALDQLGVATEQLSDVIDRIAAD